MNMNEDFFAAGESGKLLARHGLNSFEALWDLKLDAVDAPNTTRGGWSTVYRMDLEDESGKQHGFYLKRQDNHLTRSLWHPFGEPTFAREYRAIRIYARDKIPALEAVAFAQRRHAGHQRALLVTKALDHYAPLDQWLEGWKKLPRTERKRLIRAIATLVSRLHRSGKVHHCLYAKHIFIRMDADVAKARLIDLEKTRRSWLGKHDLISDLATLNRRTTQPTRTQRLSFLLAYLDKRKVDEEVRVWVRRINKRIQRKSVA
jgi:hypothetical protein